MTGAGARWREERDVDDAGAGDDDGEHEDREEEGEEQLDSQESLICSDRAIAVSHRQ